MNCKWCKHNPFSPACDSDGKCDFKMLDFTKEAILQRVTEESELVKAAKKTLVNMSASKLELRAEDEIRVILDKVKGIELMMVVLQKEFGVQEKELKDVLVVQKDSFITKAKLAGKLAMMRSHRGGNK